MSYVLIKQDECKGCKLCMKACPRGVLGLSGNINKLGYESVSVIKETECVGCGICYYSCPEPGALSVYKDESKNNKTHDSNSTTNNT